MIVHFQLRVPPEITIDPDRLVPYVQKILPTTITPDAMTITADHDTGLLIHFDLTYQTLADAKAALAKFMTKAEKLPEPQP